MIPYRIIGIDPSLTATGICTISHPGTENEDVDVYLLDVKKGKLTDLQRQLAILEELRVVLQPSSKDSKHTIVFIEDYAYSKNQGKVFTRAELVGMMKYLLCEEYEYTTYLIGITSLKKFITGKGNGGKELMEPAVYAKYGFSVADMAKSTRDNIVDAYALAQYGMYFLANKKLDVVRIGK